MFLSKVERHQQLPPPPIHLSPTRPVPSLPPRMPKEQSPHRPTPINYQAKLPQLPKRQGLIMPLPQENGMSRGSLERRGQDVTDIGKFN